jgi:hypothetical protein
VTANLEWCYLHRESRGGHPSFSFALVGSHTGARAEFTLYHISRNLSREKSKIKIKIIFPKTLDFWLPLCYNYITKEREVIKMNCLESLLNWLCSFNIEHEVWESEYSSNIICVSIANSEEIMKFDSKTKNFIEFE